MYKMKISDGQTMMFEPSGQQGTHVLRDTTPGGKSKDLVFIHDNGDEFIITLDEKSIRLDYDVAESLLIAITCALMNDPSEWSISIEEVSTKTLITNKKL